MSIFRSPELAETVPAAAYIVVMPLSPRETEVLELVATGATNPEIGVSLIIETATVRTHISNIYGKLGVHNRMEAVAAARQLGLISTDARLSPISAAILVLLQVQPMALAELAALGIFDSSGEV